MQKAPEIESDLDSSVNRWHHMLFLTRAESSSSSSPSTAHLWGLGSSEHLHTRT